MRTEAECYFSLLPTMEGSREALYVAYPWAACLNGLGRIRPPLIPRGFGSRVFTVCQHVRFRELMPAFRELGIKVVFAPHALVSEREIDGIRILGFPHWPANYTSGDAAGPARYLFSFVGAANTRVRRAIVAGLGSCENGFVKGREQWHFDHGPDGMASRKSEYEDALASSEFILCPRGVGPSTLRIFEALASGRTPVILADDLQLPAGIPWEKCSLRYRESEVESIPQMLGSIDRATRASLQAKARQVGEALLENLASPVMAWLPAPSLETWMTTEERQFFESYLSAEQTVLEWGSGGSTVAFSRMVSRYVSIEHDPTWFERVRKITGSEDVFLVEASHVAGPRCPTDFEDYVRFPAELGLRFDRVLIDGRCRVACAHQLVKSGLLAERGLVFIHDWNRARYRSVLKWYDVVAEIGSRDPDRNGIVALKPKQSPANVNAPPATS